MHSLTRLFRFLRGRDDGIKRRTVRAGMWVGVTSTVWTIISIARTIVLARLLTPEIFGLWAVCMTITRGLSVFSETGFASALIQRQHRAEEARDTAFTLLIIRGALLCLVTIAAAPLFAEFYKEPILLPLVSVLGISFLISGFHNINTILQQKELEYRRIALLDQSSVVLGFIFVVIVTYMYRSPWALVAGQLFTVAITVVLSYVVIPNKPHLAFDKTLAKELFHYGKFVSGAAMIAFITLEIDNIVIGRVVGMETLGFYAIAYMLANLPATHLAKIVSGVMLPAYSKLQSDFSALRDAYQRTLGFVSMLSIPAAVGIGVLAPQIIEVIYGERWLPAVNALRLLAVFGCFRSIGVLSGYLYNATGRPKISFYFTLSKLILISILIYPLTANFGIEGTAIAITIPSVLAFFVDFIVLHRIVGLEASAALRPVLKTVVFSAIMGVVLVYFQLYVSRVNLLSLMASVAVGGLLYVALIWRDLRRMYEWISAGR